MKMIHLVFVLLALSAVEATASIPVSRRMTCPIGGGSFDFATTTSYSSWGARPDGRPFGSWHFPLDLPECPDNGLVIYDRFSGADLARLEPLIASPEYQALRRSGDTTYYRAYWLMQRMGAPATQVLWMLVQASWQTDGNPGLRRRYLEELVERSPALGEPRDVETIAVRARVINALRELGRFEEAAAMLVATPVESIAAESSTVRSTADWRGHYRRLGIVIARRDASAEPLDMIPRREAERICTADTDRLDEAHRAICREWASTAGASPGH
jgi:hypothetical protein